MSTQINVTQNNFANQATEFNAPATKKSQALVDGALSKVNDTSEVSGNSANQLKQQPLSEQALNQALNNEESSEVEEALVIDEALEVIADFMQLSSRNINFQQDDASDRTIIKFFDSESKELIKQFPSEEVLEIAQKIVKLRQDVGEKTGIFLEEKV
jgi:flagellar protein FlaG